MVGQQRDISKLGGRKKKKKNCYTGNILGNTEKKFQPVSSANLRYLACQSQLRPQKLVLFGAAQGQFQGGQGGSKKKFSESTGN